MRRGYRRLRTQADLDGLPFLNLMVVLVTVLVVSGVLALTPVIELNVQGTPGVAAEDPPIRPVVLVYRKRLSVTDGDGRSLREIEPIEGEPHYQELRQVMKQLKARWPEQEAITIKVRPDTPYQTLVRVMDTVRSFQAVELTSLVEVKLFPDISVGDAPDTHETDLMP